MHAGWQSVWRAVDGVDPLLNMGPPSDSRYRPLKSRSAPRQYGSLEILIVEILNYD